MRDMNEHVKSPMDMYTSYLTLRHYLTYYSFSLDYFLTLSRPD